MRAGKIDELQKIRMGLRYLRSLKGAIMKGYLCRSFSVSLTVQEMPADVVRKRIFTIPRSLSLNLCVNLMDFCVNLHGNASEMPAWGAGAGQVKERKNVFAARMT
jgi:hypothetical protein